MKRHDLLLKRIRSLCAPLKPLRTAARPFLPSSAGEVRAVLFDFYGTLFMSASGDIGADREQAAALAAALRAVRMPLRDTALAREGARAYTQAIVQHRARRMRAGIRHPEVDIRIIWRRLLTRWLDAGWIAGAVNDATVERLAVEYESRVNPVWPMPGWRRTLKALSGRGLKLGLISNAQFYTPLMFEALTGIDMTAAGFDPDWMIYSYEEGEAKPSRALFDRLVKQGRREGIAPNNMVYVGNDLLKDVLPAQAAGMRAILFAGDRRSLRLHADHPRCQGRNPDGIITAWRQMVEWVS